MTQKICHRRVPYVEFGLSILIFFHLVRNGYIGVKENCLISILYTGLYFSFVSINGRIKASVLITSQLLETARSTEL